MSIKLGDDHVRVPKLDVGGTNWVLYKERLTWAADAKGLAGHLDGTSVIPTAPPMAGGNAAVQAVGAAAGAAVAAADAGEDADDADNAAAGGAGGGGAGAAVLVGGNPGAGAVPDPAQVAYQAELVTWKKNEAVVKQLIASTIPDSLFMKIRARGTAREIWMALAAEFERRSRMISLDLRRRLQEQRCGEKADVRAHFTKLRTMYEDLAAMGHTPEDDDFYAIILGSMPTSFESYISSLTATSTVTGNILTPEQLMAALTDEYDRRALRSKPGRSGGESSMDVTLVSIGRIVWSGSSVEFQSKGCQVSNSRGDVVACIPLVKGLYRTKMRRGEAAMPMLEGEEGEPTETRAITLDEAHRMLGHISYDAARDAITRGLVKGVSLIPGSKPTVCDACEAGKMSRKPIAKERVRPRAAAVGDELHSDVWGPAGTETLGRRLYNSLFIDDHSRHTIVYLQRAKAETFESYKKVEAFYRTQKGVQIKCLHTDRGGEYLSNEFSEHLATHGTTRKLTVHDTPEYNGVGERANRTHFEKVRAMLHDSGLPKALWGEALNYAVYTKNRTPTRALDGKTPHEVFWGTKPDISHLHPWGCEVRVHTPGGSKLADRARIARWVGWDEASDAHRIYWPDRRIVTVERSVRFNVVDTDVVVPLEGERDDAGARTDTNLDKRAPTPSLQPVPDASTDEPPPLDLELPAIPPSQPPVDEKPVEAEAVPETVSERPKRVRKESDYVKRLRSGEGSVGGRRSGQLLPKGMREGTESTKKTTVEEVEDEEGFVMVSQEEREDWEMVELAMATATGEAEWMTIHKTLRV